MDWNKIEPLFELCSRTKGGEEEWEIPIENFLPAFQTALEEAPDGYREHIQDFLDYVKEDSKVYAFDTIYILSGRAGFRSEDRTKSFILRMA